MANNGRVDLAKDIVKHKFGGLISGGKDSIYSIYCLVQDGHSLVALGNLFSDQELDSYMYQTAGFEVIDTFSEVLGVPLLRRPITGKPLCTTLEYTPQDNDEVEDLYILLKDMKDFFQITAISCGAIHSTYQRSRLINVCQRLDLLPMTPLWGLDETVILRSIISCGIEAVIVKTACAGLFEQHIGKLIDGGFLEEMVELNKKYGAHICGEGGEYETIVLYCPVIYKKRIKIISSHIEVLGQDDLAPVMRLKIPSFAIV